MLNAVQMMNEFLHLINELGKGSPTPRTWLTTELWPIWNQAAQEMGQ